MIVAVIVKSQSKNESGIDNDSTQEPIIMRQWSLKQCNCKNNFEIKVIQTNVLNITLILKLLFYN